MHIVKQYARSDASTEEVSEMEARAGFSLPSDYAQFLLEWNGGKPDVGEFEFLTFIGHKQASAVRAFPSLDRSDHYYSAHRNLDMLHGRLPRSTIPIAEDDLGNVILLELRETGRGNIYFWDHECEGDEDPYASLSIIAPSFTEFVKQFGVSR